MINQLLLLICRRLKEGGGVNGNEKITPDKEEVCNDDADSDDDEVVGTDDEDSDDKESKNILAELTFSVYIGG